MQTVSITYVETQNRKPWQPIMAKIQLLYVKNIISRKRKVVQQTLSFFMLLEHVDHGKKVDIIWAGEDGLWQTLAAQYHSHQEKKKEYWHAEIDFPLSDEQSLPGNIQFSLRYQIAEGEYWDNNLGLNYSSQADSGIRLAYDTDIQNICFAKHLEWDQKSLPIIVSVDQALEAEKVIIYWTADDWKQTHQANCQIKKNYWDKKSRSNARNPNQYGYQTWEGYLKIENAYRIQYCIASENKDGIVWENNYGNNYSIRHQQLKVLILNLHCYQEENQDEKFSQIAKAINELDVDIICFQEVAELWNNGQGDWESNSAKIINDRLDNPFHLHTDWSHLGFDRYREGVAILSRFPFSNLESRYVSESQNTYNIHSRKVILAQVEVPFLGLINVFSAHLSWLEDGFQEQFKSLREWAAEKHTNQVIGTMLCGDFNISAGSTGYHQVIDANEYTDQYLIANTSGLSDNYFRINDSHWQHHLDDDYRIDYIFMNNESFLRVTSAKALFTEQDYGKVSDHCGYLMSFEPK
jgi:maltose 6'-phosphate phosphatase